MTGAPEQAEIWVNGAPLVWTPAPRPVDEPSYSDAFVACFDDEDGREVWVA